MAELSVLDGRCLDRRIGTEAELRAEVLAWEEGRNCAEAKVDWRFTAADARIKPRKPYPTIET
jgi:hypothetical protein